MGNQTKNTTNYTNSSKNSDSTSNQRKHPAVKANLTWEEALDTWDNATYTWEETGEGTWGNQTKN